MAKTSDLLAELSPFFDKEPATLAVIGRFLREAGLIASGKSGAGAADLGADDATALLLGAAALEPPRHVAEAVASYLALRPSARNAPSRLFPQLSEQASFGGAIRWLIAEASEVESMYGPMYYEGSNAALQDRPLGTEGSPLEIWVDLFANRTARITILDSKAPLTEQLDVLTFVPTHHAAGSPHSRRSSGFDLAPVLALHRFFPMSEPEAGQVFRPADVDLVDL